LGTRTSTHQREARRIFLFKTKVVDYKVLMHTIKRDARLQDKYNRVLSGLIKWEDNEISRRYSEYENVITQ
jgi:hypothetical protein